jgi:glycosyltransferase involved in cell wall biosynthesis
MGIIRLGNVKEVENHNITSPIMQDQTIQMTKRSGRKSYMEEIKQDKVLTTRDISKTWENFMNNGWLDGKMYQPGPFEGIKNRWKNEPCFIIGSGPDLNIFIKKIGWKYLDSKHSIGINHVIESYDGFEYFIFLDRRFLKKTTYDLGLYKGTIFAKNSTGISNGLKNIIRYRCNNIEPTTDINKGLYSSRFSGLVALNLAVISGANPIYLIGFGMGKDGNSKNFHYRKDYQGVGQHPDKQFTKYNRVYNHFKKFKKWYNKIIHITAGQSIAGFKKIDFRTFRRRSNITLQNRKYKTVNINKGKRPRIAHLSFSNDINIHADITRAIINNCHGSHSLHHISQAPKNVDLYITEHFISTDKAIRAWPYKNKTINIVHSMNCIPTGNFLCNVVLTNAWRKFLRGKNIQNVRVIYGGIDLLPYKSVETSNEKVFGRITRWSPGKIPFWWNDTVREILDEDQNIKCLMFINHIHRGRKLLKHKRMIYDKTCKITDFKGKFLKRLGVYVHANGSFKETMSHAVIEAMATGLPIVYLKEPAVTEVIGPAGIGVENKIGLRKNIMKLLYDENLRESYSKLSKARSKIFDINKTIESFNNLIKEILG